MALSFFRVIFHFSLHSLQPSSLLAQVHKNEAIPHFTKTYLTDEWLQKANPALYTITLFTRSNISCQEHSRMCGGEITAQP